MLRLGRTRIRLGLGLGLGFWVLWSLNFVVESTCSKGCNLALASYYVWMGSNLSFIAQTLNAARQDLLDYNPAVPDDERIQSFTRVNVPFSCNCINGETLGHTFQYKAQTGDTYDTIAKIYFSNLTTASWIQKFNNLNPNSIRNNMVVNVTVNCSCGNKSVSDKYGLFLTYPLRPEENLTYITQETNASASLLQRYNPNAKFSGATGLVYIPAKDKNGRYLSLTSSKGHVGVVGGVSVVAVAIVMLVGVTVFYIRRKRQRSRSSFLLSDQVAQDADHAGSPAGATGITIDKSVEFPYEELAQATNNFSMANQIGAGGFGAVYYAELRGEKAAVKKMDMHSKKEFLAELKVLTNVHHLNLVRLIGYCIEDSLFLVYDYINNGNLSEHLRSSGNYPLPWSTRVQIALDSARGLEYIHEHTVPVYIHRDIKPANILLDKQFHAKVADFGLTKLTDAGIISAPTHFMGTFGYIAPEYAQYGDVSPKVDVYSFGVVLYQLISAKEAVVKNDSSSDNSKGLVGLFDEVLSRPDPNEIRELIDPRLEDNYPLDSVHKMAYLAKACTQENRELRPSMRSVVVALMSLSSATEDWDVGSFYQKTFFRQIAYQLKLPYSISEESIYELKLPL